MSDTVVLSKWVLASGRVMPELPDALANRCLARLGWDGTDMTEAEKREAVETVARHMLTELAWWGAGR